jgi:hypothetical protein
MKKKLLAAACLAGLCFSTAFAADDPLTTGFAQPPASAHPQTWWHWMNGNITKAGITADLEAMHRVGIQEANIITVASDIPAGPVPVMSPQFFDMVEFAAKEADRLGMTLCMDNCPGWSSSGGPWVKPEQSMMKLTSSEVAVKGPMKFADNLKQPPTRRGFYRDITVLAFKTPAGDGSHDAFRIKDIKKKNGENGEEVSLKSVEDSAAEALPPEKIIQQNQIVDLTAMTKTDGSLNWEVPAGDWTIIRFGYTTTGVTNHPAPKEATGLECDKLSKAGLDASWNGMMQPILDRLGPLGGKVLVDCLIDSYETGGQNWTPAMLQEFKTRRGYDPTKYLPVMTGRVVDSPAVSERFLWDMRRTIADLFADNYFGYFTELCHKHGMKSMIEPYTGPFESIQSGALNDIPMGEFWAGSESQESVKLASSIGHVYGQKVIATESFTGAPEHGRWTDDPFSLKALGDLAFTQGINRFVFHRYAHQPWMNRFPGMTMGQWGINLDRTNTWFEKSKPWMDYLARSQFLLQQGRFVADAAYFCGESCPVVTRIGTPPLPKGYDYDSINADVLLNKATVKDGRLVLADGMSYAVLVLPESDPQMTPALLQKIDDFVFAGLTVVGPRPDHSPSLQNYPQCDASVKTLAGVIWGDCDGKTVTEHRRGKGQVFWGKSMGDVFASIHVTPDFDIAGSKSPVIYIHRTTDAGEVYFVANHGHSFADVNCSFRVTGKVPELWHPETGTSETAPVYSDPDGRISVPLRLDPSGSVFVVFRNPDSATDHIVRVTADTSAPQAAKAPNHLQIKKATYETTDDAGAKDVTELVKQLEVNGTLSIEATNDVLGGDPFSMHPKQLVVDYSLDGKDATATVSENGHLELPDGGPSQSPEPFDLRRTSAQTELFAHYPGTFDTVSASGKTAKITATDVPAPTIITTPWTLKFPPNWGAPAQITLDKLISWPDHSDAGVKYFSGTASYFNDLDISPEQLKDGHALYLNLGVVKNFAEVKLNGQSLGILWKPPFRLDITSAVKPGKNTLEIDVTNLWPNRLIGDAQLPEDTKWSGMKPAGWPQFLLDGKPSPTGRLTFTTWRHWTKDGKLLKSGLIGPVQLESGTWVPIQ